MHIDSTSRNNLINSDKEKTNDVEIKKSTSSVTPSAEKPFSPAHLPGTTQATVSSEKSSGEEAVIQPAKEKPFSQKQLSQRLARAEEKGLITRDLQRVVPTIRGFDFLSDLQALFLPET